VAFPRNLPPFSELTPGFVAILFALAVFSLVHTYHLFSPAVLLLVLGLWLWFHRLSLLGIGVFFALGFCLKTFLSFSSAPSRFYALAEVAEVQEFLGRRDPLYRLELKIRPRGAPRCIQAELPPPKRKVGDPLWIEVTSIRSTSYLPIPYARLKTVPYPSEESLSSVPSLPLTPARAFYEGILHNRFFKRGEEFPEIRWIIQAGLAHLLSISGIHVGFFLLLIQVIMRIILLALPWRFLKRTPPALLFYGRWGISLLFAYFYLKRIGLPPPSVRALFWILFPLLSLRLLRIHLARDTFVLLVILFVSALYPCSLPTLSFALSLTAMIYLVPLLWVKGTILRVVLGAILPWLGTFPLLSGWTYVNLTAPLANLFGIPFFGLWIFPLAWGYELFGSVPILGSILWDLFTFGFYSLAHLSRILLDLAPFSLPPLPSIIPRDLLLILCALPLLLEGFYYRFFRPSFSLNGAPRQTPAGLC
jgi:hypothetical protein